MRKMYWMVLALLLMCVGVAFAQDTLAVADSTVVVGQHGAEIVGWASVLFTTLGSAVYQLIKKGIAPLDRLPAYAHIAIIMAVNFIYQQFAPTLSDKIGVTMPGDIHQVTAPVVGAVLFGLAMMGVHSFGSKAWAWLKAKLEAIA